MSKLQFFLIHTLSGNGICDDVVNNEACNFDDGDCCSNKSTFGIPYCIECECKVPEIVSVYDHPILHFYYYIQSAEKNA